MVLIHRFWVGPPRPEHIWITEVVRKIHPNAELKNWTLDTLPRNPKEMIRGSDTPGHLSNMVRHWALYELGGLWLDHDVIPLRNLTEASEPWTAALGSVREGSSMWFPHQAHPMMGEMLAIGLASSSLTRNPVERSGSMHLRKVGARYPDVGYEQRVLPIDALGRKRVFDGDIWAVHLWSTQSVKRGSSR